MKNQGYILLFLLINNTFQLENMCANYGISKDDLINKCEAKAYNLNNKENQGGNQYQTDIETILSIVEDELQAELKKKNQRSN